jgi:hypothetical protein
MRLFSRAPRTSMLPNGELISQIVELTVADSWHMDFVQAYNTQVVVEDGCQLIVAQAITPEAPGCSKTTAPLWPRESPRYSARSGAE